MLERFTSRARAAVVAAREEAVRQHAPSVRAHHLLLAVVDEPTSRAARLLADLGCSAGQVRAAVARHATTAGGALDPGDVEALAAIGIDVDEVLRRTELDVGRAGPRRGPRRLPFSAEARKTLELSLREALALHHRGIGTEHLLLGVLRDRRTPASAALADLGVTHAAVRDALVEALRGTG